jgi:hypothetical protein
VLLTAVLSFVTFGAEANDDGDYCPLSRQQQELDFFAAPIKTAADAKRIAAFADATPLAALPEKTRIKFLERLRFTDRGLASYDYSFLTQNLSASQVYEILAMFGRQRDIVLIPSLSVENEIDQSLINLIKLQAANKCNNGDRVGMECTRPGNCKRSTGNICTSNC